MSSIKTLHDIRVAAEKYATDGNRAYWFDDSAMKFFSTVLYNDSVYSSNDGAYFITSDQFNHLYQGRRFTVRFCSVSGEISTIGKFGQFETRNGAANEIEKILKGK